MHHKTLRTRTAFTLIELMVAVAIIALLVSIMIPGFSAVRRNAKIVTTQAIFDGIEIGLESYRGESALGGLYPPSRTDNPGNVLLMQDPFSGGGGVGAQTDVEPVSGASLIVYGLVGADGLGTPGFVDLDKDGVWWDNMSAAEGGAYYLDRTTAEPTQTRYPSTGSTYVDETTRDRVRSLQQLIDQGIILDGYPAKETALAQQVFTDAWDLPILYYRANRGGRVMVNKPGQGPPGVYDLRDNAVLTGSPSARGATAYAGLDFGQPQQVQRKYSRMALSQYPNLKPELSQDVNIILTQPYEGHFEQFILDRSVKAQNRPVNPDSFLLISAGPDAIYGTDDDIVNWEQPD